MNRNSGTAVRTSFDITVKVWFTNRSNIRLLKNPSTQSDHWSHVLATSSSRRL